MDSLIQVITNMNNRTRNRAVIIITALIIPSITYFTLNFPQQMYSSDLIKVLVMGVCINFFTVCISLTLHFIKFMIVADKTVSSLKSTSNTLSNIIVDLRERNSKQHTTLKDVRISLEKEIQNEDEISINDEMISKVEDDINKSDIILKSTENLQNELISYLNDLLDPLRFLSESSLITIVQVLLCCLINIITSQNIDFSIRGVLWNVFQYISFYYLIATFYECFNKDFRLKNIEEKLEELNNLH
ncbi:hypothetical protein [Proteiniclasticum ruminis]|uniref:Uncharacterized protein n=1 Tax=Proteiniclasticum ruminis TaxID=398199 RepID=A0A1I5BB95_9CLOT|nr:hypothetical protein [Proteiniclasticum ruminis]SFN71966.1 hypothetical protein SAMN04488695_104113 [Proteiniclasticum ruminis]